METDPTRALAWMIGLPVITFLGGEDGVDGEARVHVETTVSRTGCPSCGVIARAKGRSRVEFVDLAIGYAVWRRTRGATVVAGSFLVGLIVQGLVDFQSKGALVQFIPGLSVDVPKSVPSVADVFGYRVIGTYLFGDRGTQSPWLVNHGVLAIVSTILFVLGLALLLPGADRPLQVLSLVFLGYAVMIFVVPVWVRQVANARYCVVPIFLVASSLAVLVAPRTRSGREFVRRIGRPVFVAQILLVTCIGFSVTNYRSLSPDWSLSVDAAQAACASAPADRIVTIRTDAGNEFPSSCPAETFCRPLRKVTVEHIQDIWVRCFEAEHHLHGIIPPATEPAES